MLTQVRVKMQGGFRSEGQAPRLFLWWSPPAPWDGLAFGSPIGVLGPGLELEFVLRCTGAQGGR